MHQIRVAVLGSTGMLGHVVSRELMSDTRFCVTNFCRTPGRNEHWIDAKSAMGTRSLFFSSHRFDYVINCVGLIKQLDIKDRRDWFAINSVFPNVLQSNCVNLGIKLIHVSTDCVFSGIKGLYSENDHSDANDDYGLSKRTGEPEEAMVIRTSVIGKELQVCKRSLLEWAISNAGTTVNGFTNHLWNGLTTLEYANVCKKIMINNAWREGIYHIHSNDVSKYELLKIFNDAYDLNLDIIPTEAQVTCDRRLTTIRTLNEWLKIPSVVEMVNQLSRAC